jgi:hypothetical protein
VRAQGKGLAGDVGGRCAGEEEGEGEEKDVDTRVPAAREKREREVALGLREKVGRGSAHAGERKEGGGAGPRGETWARGEERAREGERERVLGWARLLFFLSFPFSFPSSFLYSTNSNKSN